MQSSLDLIELYSKLTAYNQILKEIQLKKSFIEQDIETVRQSQENQLTEKTYA